MIVVHDRFMTGSGTFVDASMLGGQAQGGPFNALQDSEMMVYDDSDADEDQVVDHDKMVPEASPKKPGTIISPFDGSGHSQKQSSASAKKQKQQSNTSAAEEEKADGKKKTTRTSSKGQTKKGAAASAAASSGSQSATKPSQVRTRAQKCKKSD